MDEEQSLQSPIAGSLRGIRRSVSSSIFNPRPRAVQPQPDPITTNLLEQNSLQLTTLSNRFEAVAGQISSLNQSLAGIKDNLALSESLDRQREAAKQRREAILAEQGLREGKESAREEKIRSSLSSPVAKVAGKVQKSLFSLERFFLILAGGWLTSKGIQLLQALAEGNLLKLERLKEEFTKGLIVIGATITAFTIGIGTTFRVLTSLAGTVGRFAFGGLFRNALKGLTKLFSTALAKLAPLLSTLAFVTGPIGKLLGFGVGTAVVKKGLDDTAKRITGKTVAASVGATAATGGKFLPQPKPKVQITGDVTKPGLFGRLKNLFSKGKGTIVGETSKKVTTGAGRGMFSKIFKFGAKGNIISVIIGMLLGQSFDEAIVSLAGFKIATAKAATALSPLLLAPFPGARPLYGILVLLAGILGSGFVDGIYKSIKGFIFGKKEDKNNLLPELDVTNILTEDDAIERGVIDPIKSNTSVTADLISQDLEGTPEIINIPTNTNQGNQGREVAVSNNGGSSNDIPTISFNNIGDYDLLSQSSYGVGA